ncbi:MAG: hypothetical protein Q8P24_00625 [Desulfobacterales bacterium]|nr:hypothetical protein [Desulfobacterales bacterium]
MTIQPEGEALRKAVQWISEKLLADPGGKSTLLIEAACMKFNLSPADAEFLYRNLKTN